MSRKYEPGEKVRIRCDLHRSKDWCGSGLSVTIEMVKRVGDIVTINKIVDADNDRYSIVEDKGKYCWHSSMLDWPADEPTKSSTESDAVASDAVSHPSHYNVGKIEVIDFIEDKNLNFNLGNAVKYIARCQYKAGGTKRIEDLEKAIWYIQHQIAVWKGETA